MRLKNGSIIFETSDGRWNVGFWEYYPTNLENPKVDTESDIEYSYDSFWFTSMGHDTPEEAHQASTSMNTSYDGGNIIHYIHNEEECNMYEIYAKQLLNAQRLARNITKPYPIW